MPKRIHLVPVDLAEDVPPARLSNAVHRLCTIGEISAEDAIRILVFGPRPTEHLRIPEDALRQVKAA